MKRCGNCQLHHDLTGETEVIGWKNCLGAPSDLCAVYFSSPDAPCIYPDKFIPVLPRKDTPCTPISNLGAPA